MSLANIPLNQPAANCLTALINYDNKQNFAVSDLVFTGLTIGNTPTDTNIVVTPAMSTGLTSQRDLDYERLDLADYFQGAVPVLYIQGDITVQSVLDALLDQFQIYGADGPNDGFTVTIAVDNSSVTFVPNVNHLVWVGAMTATIDQRPVLASVITTNSLSGFALPSNLSAQCPLAQVFYGLLSGQSMISQCQSLHSGDRISEYLATWAFGVSLTNDPWYASASPGPFNAYGARVRYNGPATGPYAIPTSTGNYPGNVVVIDLGTACTNRCGSLMVVYQPPSSPSPSPSPAPAPTDSNLLYN